MPYKFAEHVFGIDKFEETLPANVFMRFKKTVDEKQRLDPEVANFVANEIKKWAETMGVTHFTHWFLPLTGLTAGKQNTFLNWTGKGKIISEFSGSDLIKGEPDASSFPHGGMRSTFEARGYTAWDPTSPVFISKSEKGCVLFIPSVFFGYNGKVLDKKTPLLRSQKLINQVSLNILKKFNQQASWVKNMIGAEQEFFLVNERDYKLRPDLRTLGRLLFAARPAKGQQMGDHYFGAIPPKVLRFFEDVEEEAFKLGIPIKTRHNEVAPNQFEIAPLYEEANVASDHNQMLMDLLGEIAKKHAMVCLLNEKPFRFFNGSGKHVNWSLIDSGRRNLFSPGETSETRFVFLSMLAGFLMGIDTHNDLVQSVLASPGNEIRLGGHEAPPSIISVYLGQELQAILQDIDAFISGKVTQAPLIKIEESVPPILHDMSDRNRTSPVAFTGNKFEFRMPGSSISLAFPIAVINLAVADGIEHVYNQIASIRDEKKIIRVLGDLLGRHSTIVYEGDNYDKKWRDEAEKRSLYIPESIPQAMDRMRDEKNIALFETYHILNRDEIEARAEITIEMYVKTIEIELRVAAYMLRSYILPAALKHQQLLLNSVQRFPPSLLTNQPSLLDVQLEGIETFTRQINDVMAMISVLDDYDMRLQSGTMREKAELCSRYIRPYLKEISDLSDKIEESVDHHIWEMPRAADILFR
ncbi:MAG: glutamine synthetase III [Candidatus Omnitrophota bacterium]